MKICYKCKQLLPLENFGKNKSKKDGLQCECKTCKSLLRKEYYNNNKKLEMKKNKEWVKLNPDKAKTNKNKSIWCF